MLRRVVALALLLTACSSGHRVPTAKVRSTPPTTADPYAVPAVIDVTYVNRVLAALDQVDGDATREAVEAKALTPRFMDLLHSEYEDPAYSEQIRAWHVDATRQFAGYRVPPGNAHTSAARLIQASASCVFVEVKRDYAAVTTKSNPDYPHYLALRRRAKGASNLTAWLIFQDFVRIDHSDPGQRCTA